MPNWVNCKLTVTNSTPKLEAFLKEHGLSFEAIVKPERPEDDENNFGTVGAQVNAWGTKWDLTENEAKETAASLLDIDECTFDTAWSPPSEAIRVLSELTGASFRLAYYEPGCWFWGVEGIANGWISNDLDGNGSKQQLKEFFVEYFGWDEDYANEELGWDEEGEVTEE